MRNIEDYLDEDPIIERQNYVIISYLLPSDNNQITYPLFKVRGSFRTIDECNNRIEILGKKDNYFNMMICEVGKYGSLLPHEQLAKNSDIDIKYRNEKLNEMVQKYKESRDKADLEFLNRKEKLMQSCSEEVTESKEDISARIDFLTKEINHMKENVSEYEKFLSDSLEKLNKL